MRFKRVKKRGESSADKNPAENIGQPMDAGKEAENNRQGHKSETEEFEVFLLVF